jgi:hypothetical protein
MGMQVSSNFNRPDFSKSIEDGQKDVNRKGKFGGVNRNARELRQTDKDDALERVRRSDSDSVTLQSKETKERSEPTEGQKNESAKKSGSAGGSSAPRKRKRIGQSEDISGRDVYEEEDVDKNDGHLAKKPGQGSGKKNDLLTENSLSIRQRYRYNSVLNKTPQEILGDVPPPYATVAQAKVNEDLKMNPDILTKIKFSNEVGYVDLEPIQNIATAPISDLEIDNDRFPPLLMDMSRGMGSGA